MIPQPEFLPVTKKEAHALGIRQFDIILITGDAYVDHPSFGTALIGRILWDAGYAVGVIARPDWREPGDLTALGTPRLFFGVSSGNVDSMVNNYTPALKRRRHDVYAPGGAPFRPDRAAIVYSDRVHALFPGVPVVLGGIEASLRRFAHYDYWSDKVRQSILADAPADILIFGMGEQQIREVAGRLDAGAHPSELNDIRGTMFKASIGSWRGTDHGGYVVLPGFDEVSSDKSAYARAFALHHREQDPVQGRPVAQQHKKTVVIQNPPALPLSQRELDHVYELPYTRRAHPMYRQPVPALETVKFSVTSHRGCIGSCSFCALSHHQGRIIQIRSIASIVREVEGFTRMPEFRGVVQDVGGPTANMYATSCPRWAQTGACIDKSCIDCRTIIMRPDVHLDLLRELRNIPGVKHVFISSGVRYDLIPPDDDGWLEEVTAHHISGHMKVAPEHISEPVIRLMRKPCKEIFERFSDRFGDLQAGRKKKQYLLPYFMSGHPGCRVEDMVELAEYIRDHNMYTEQVQDFTPTPMSASTCMYHTGIDPFTGNKVHVARGREKQIQRALLHWKDPKNSHLVREGLLLACRSDLIGMKPGSLIPENSGR
jgi:uncharacterized radical SAM protein YgiQ